MLKAPSLAYYLTCYSQALSFYLPASPEEEQMLTGWSMLHFWNHGGVGVQELLLVSSLLRSGPSLSFAHLPADRSG